MKISNVIKQNWLLILAIIYLLLPVDIIPDVVPVVGNIDDSMLFLLELILRWRKSIKNTKS